MELDPKYTIGIMPTVFQGTGEMSWKAAVPDAEGRYEFNDIDSTSYRICLATAFGLDVIVLGEVDVPEASDKEANYVLKRGVMSGLVCDAATGLPSLALSSFYCIPTHPAGRSSSPRCRPTRRGNSRFPTFPTAATT